MPSDSARRERLAWLRSQGLGLACGFAVVVLLAVGSFVLAATRDGASRAVGMDDLRGFFTPPSWVHLWLYLLFPVAGLYAVNTVLATWDTVTRRWRAGVRSPAAFAGSVVHLGFLLALVAHAVGGLLGADRGAVLVAGEWQEVPGFGEARLRSLETEALPDGTPRAVRARLELRAPDGTTREATVGYNGPLATAAGGRVALLSDQGQAWMARLVSGDASCRVAEGQACRLAGERVDLLRLGRGPGGAPAALLRARGFGGVEEVRWLRSDGELALPGGRPLQLAGVAPEDAVVLRVRDTPGTPWALAAALVLAAGLAMMWRRFLPRRREAAVEEDPADAGAPSAPREEDADGAAPPAATA